jgi:hypothetical protein
MHSRRIVGEIGPGFVNKSGLKEPTFDILVAPEYFPRNIPDIHRNPLKEL